jgi:two-component system, OmpR family, response regulator ParR
MINTEIELGSAILDTFHRSLIFNGDKVSFTTTEFDAIIAFAESFGRPLTRDELSLRLCGSEWNGRNRAIDVCVGRLRRKLRERTRGYLQIRSVRGVGYFLINRD